MKKKALVTGANGFIASWLVRYLLEDGYEVHGTVRDASNTRKVSHLLNLKGTGTLTLHNADLLDETAFDEPMKGCEVVFHTASPFLVGNQKDPYKSLIEPALRGTENVLHAAGRSGTVKRVVLTSSVAAIYGDNTDIRNTDNGVFDESHWNLTSSRTHQPYPYSKTVAERKAWEIAAAQDQWDLVTINPSFVMGPALSAVSSSASVDFMKDLAAGKMKAGLPALFNGVVDVREVASAHKIAAEKPDAEGRYIISGKVCSLIEMADIIAQKFPEDPLPKRKVPKWLIWLLGPAQGFSRKFISRNVGVPIRFDTKRSKEELGITYRPVEETLVDNYAQLREG